MPPGDRQAITPHMGTQMSLFARFGGAPAITAAAQLSTPRFWPAHLWPRISTMEVSLELARLGDPAIVPTFAVA